MRGCVKRKAYPPAGAFDLSVDLAVLGQAGCGAVPIDFPQFVVSFAVKIEIAKRAEQLRHIGEGRRAGRPLTSSPEPLDSHT